LLVLVSATAAGLALGLALGLPLTSIALAGLAAGGVAVGLELAVTERRAPAPPAPRQSAVLVDTSAIVDGRIADVAATGFLDARLLVPRFVLRELQRLADGADPQKRSRGKRGFDVLQRLQAAPTAAVEIIDDDAPETREVDQKLLDVARRRGVAVLTTDYNLNRLAEVSGIVVLNVNDLANALKPAVLPGDTLRVQLSREGKEPGQGVGFLEDGTMVVVDQGRKLVGQEVSVVVTSALQTSAGRMVFGRLRADEAGAEGRDA
jgi:uncharacterized protein YacL